MTWPWNLHDHKPWTKTDDVKFLDCFQMYHCGAIARDVVDGCVKDSLLFFPLNFALNLKRLQKIKYLLKRNENPVSSYTVMSQILEQF